MATLCRLQRPAVERGVPSWKDLSLCSNWGDSSSHTQRRYQRSGFSTTPGNVASAAPDFSNRTSLERSKKNGCVPQVCQPRGLILRMLKDTKKSTKTERKQNIEFSWTLFYYLTIHSHHFFLISLLPLRLLTWHSPFSCFLHFRSIDSLTLNFFAAALFTTVPVV